MGYPASRALFVEAERTSRRDILTGVASMIPLVAMVEKADAAGSKVDPALEAELRSLGGAKQVAPPKVKSFVEDAAPVAPPKKKELKLPSAKKAEPAPAPAPSPGFSLPSLPKSFPKLPFP